MELHEIIKDLRNKREWSQEQAAAKLNISQSLLSLIEAGKRDPKKSIIKSICRVYKIPPAILAWMSASEKDVQKGKIEAFRVLKPAVDNLIKEFFEAKQSINKSI